MAYQNDDDESHEEEDKHHGVDDGEPVYLKAPGEEVVVLDHSAPVGIADPGEMR